ncbi:uncharacterized protein L969DRAFT_88729 [Mixia osmundae IAM 14324]|uniref:Mitochondrial carrier n=1 Tax=Mixia osmundae (strain CBS 9802 / IAM 14324 / JCM 22182 / KY 12970) TaxID=764103 RepID=G7DZ77_MIXOS|nr:uncharacterized protein L969DRAFT_88729 [Mixia osmundae IAM 14324]KEI38289.1 hypothetical protein L969DRAFT_88729 [Mixia osmundae IAM 14324]GAA95887.1 hypothetical protein E5Q_02545 [Mixia osmundae IAM 14324]
MREFVQGSSKDLERPPRSKPGQRTTGGRREREEVGDILRSGLAGGIAGCVAKTSVAPLDRVKILFQTQEPAFAQYAGSFSGLFRASSLIYKETGVRGLLQGHSATLLRIFPYAAIKFMAYDEAHRILMPTKDKESSMRLFLAGSIAGVTSVFLTYPLELIRVRLAFDVRHTTSERPRFLPVVRRIYSEGKPLSTATIPPNSAFSKIPLLKFYRGFTVSIVGMVPYAGTSFAVWGLLRKSLPTYFDRSTIEEHRTLLDLACGAIAGATSQTTSYPFEVVRRRMQIGGLLRPDRLVGFWEAAQAIQTKSGWRGFFVGLSIGYIKVVPMTAISYSTWEGCKRFLGVKA